MVCFSQVVCPHAFGAVLLKGFPKEVVWGVNGFVEEEERAYKAGEKIKYNYSLAATLALIFHIIVQARPWKSKPSYLLKFS